MKKIRMIIVLLCSLMLVNYSSIVSYASCPISESNDVDASAEAEKYYNMLPGALRSQFESEGWEILIKDVASVNLACAALGGPVGGGGYVAGFTHSFSRMIILSNTDAGGAMNHEFGHYFDFSKGKASDSSLFQDIYANEKTSFDDGSNDYAMSGSGEYFAEAFREYVECAGYLKITCPRTYNFIDGYMSAYGGTSTNDVYELTRCESHIIGKVAKATADATAQAAVNAAKAILDSGTNLTGKNAPKLDGFLDEYNELIDGINNDPEGYAHKKTGEWKDYLENIDWDKKHEDVRKSVEEKTNEINKKLEDTEYWENKGKELGNTINKLFGG